MVATPEKRKQNTLSKKKLKFETAINTFFTEKERIHTHTHKIKQYGYYAQKAYLQTSIQTTSLRV